jgi:competence protein ComEC
MIDYLQRFPFVRILLPFLAGILLEPVLPIKGSIPFLIILLLILPVICFIVRESEYYRNILGGLLFTLFFLIAGIYLSAEKNKPVVHIKADYYCATLIEKPVEKARSYKAEVLVTALIQGDSVITTREKLIIYFEKTGKAEALNPGSCIYFHQNPEEIENPGNPFEFDYKNYIGRQGISRQVYLKEQSWITSGNDPVFRITIMAEKVRDYLLDIYKSKGLTGTEFEILSALTLGYKKSMDPEIKQVFAATGASHVLAVSGLHVGIVYLVFNLFFGYLRKNRHTKYIFLLLAISFLWGFAFITGLSPSVQRSALMFTIVLIGENLRRPANIYNTLAASASVLLAINPTLFFDAGFQLSYAAVFGIVYFQPRLNALFSFKSKPAAYAWGLLTVSVAAQITTFPLSCYYFNQFPVYFWMSNFLVIPLAFVFIFLGIWILAFSPVAVVSGILAKIAILLVKILYILLQRIENLPGALVRGFNFPLIFMFLAFSLTVLLILFLETKKSRYFIIFSGLLVCSFLIASAIKIYQNQNKEIIAYKLDEPVLHLIYGRTNYILSAENILKNEFPVREINTVIKKERLLKPVIIPLETDYSDAVLQKRGNWLFFDGTIIGFPEKNCKWDTVCKPDIIITGNTFSKSTRFPEHALILNYSGIICTDNPVNENVYWIQKQGAWRFRCNTMFKKIRQNNFKKHLLYVTLSL